MTKTATNNYTLFLGSFKVENCVMAINLEGVGQNKQLLRVREGEDGELLINMNVWHPDGSTAFKIHNNKPVHHSDEYEYIHDSTTEQLVHKDAKKIVFRLEKRGTRVFRLYGHFVLDQGEIISNPEACYIRNGNAQAWLKGGSINGFGKAIVLSKDGSIGIGAPLDDIG
jgi:hypothetical protein